MAGFWITGRQEIVKGVLQDIFVSVFEYGWSRNDAQSRNSVDHDVGFFMPGPAIVNILHDNWPICRFFLVSLKLNKAKLTIAKRMLHDLA